MSSNSASGKVITVDKQAFDKAGGQAIDEGGFPVVDKTPGFEAAVEQEAQVKVDANHPDGIGDTNKDRIHDVTLEQEKRIRAQEAGLERISAQTELGTQDNCEQHTRAVAAQGSKERRRRSQRRAASMGPMADPERGDPRAELTQGRLTVVNKQSMRLTKKLDDWSRATIGRRLSGAVIGGKDPMSATVGVFEELQTAPRQVVPIEKFKDIGRKEVGVEGTVTVLWEPSSAAISQASPIEDDSGKTKFTSWKASDAPWVEGGERVRIHGAAKNWYDRRVSVAVTGWSTLHFPERGRWWE